MADGTARLDLVPQQPRSRHLDPDTVPTATLLAPVSHANVGALALVQHLQQMTQVIYMAAGVPQERLHLILCEGLHALGAVTRLRLTVIVLSLDRLLLHILSCRGDFLGLDVHVLARLMHNLKLDRLALPQPQVLLRGRDLAPEHLGRARADAVLDLMLLHHMRQTLAEALDLETLRNASHETDGVDGSAGVLEQPPDETRLIHTIVEQVVPEVCVILLLCEFDGLVDVLQAVNDEIESTLHLTRLGI